MAVNDMTPWNRAESY